MVPVLYVIVNWLVLLHLRVYLSKPKKMSDIASSACSYQTTENPTYSLFYRVFFCVYKIIKEVEGCSDHLISLDRSIHSTLLPEALPLQLDSISVAVYELVAYSITRAIRSRRIPVVPLSEQFSTLSSSQQSGKRLATCIYLPLQCPKHFDSCPFSKNVCSTSHIQQHDPFLSYSEGSADHDSPLFFPEVGEIGAGQCKETVKRGEKNILFSDPLEFVSVGYIENPATAIKSCSVCAAQALVQSTWLNFYLLQRLHLISVTQLALASFRMPPELLCVTPRMGLVHLFHSAQRFFELALHSALTLYVDCSTLRDRLSYPLPLLQFLIQDSKSLLADKQTIECVQNLQASLDMKVSRESEGSAFPASKSNFLSLSPFTNWPETLGAWKQEKNRTLGAHVFCLAHFALGLFRNISYLWPVLELFSGNPSDFSTIASSLHSSDEENKALRDQGKQEGSLLHKVKATYVLEDVLLVIRATLQKTCLIGFMDGFQGATRAIQNLLCLSQTLCEFEHECFPHLDAKHSTFKVFPPDKKPFSSAQSPADQIYTIFSKHFCLDLKIFQSWPWPSPHESPNSLFSSLCSCDKDQVGEYFEVKQIVLLLTLFFDLVEGRDELEETEALMDYLSDPHTNSTFLSADLKVKVMQAICTLSTRRREERYRRLTGVRKLLTVGVLPVLIELTNSSNGGISSRARELLGLSWLLTAEILRFSLFFLEKGPSSSHRCGKEAKKPTATHPEPQERGAKGSEEIEVEVEKEVANANAEAIKYSEAAREFLGVTMQSARSKEETYDTLPFPVSPLHASERQSLPHCANSGSSVVSNPSSSPSKAVHNWRLLFSSENIGAREFLFGFSSLPSVRNNLDCKSALKEEDTLLPEGEVVHITALLPPLWIRMWLVLCRSVFRTASQDMIFAKDKHHLPCSNLPEAPPMESIKGKKSSVSTTEYSSGASHIPDGYSSRKKKILPKLAKPSSYSKKMAKTQIQMAQRVLKAEWKLKYSTEELCFWYRWHQAFITVSPGTHSAFHSLEKKDDYLETRFYTSLKTGSYTIPSLSTMLYSLLNHTIPPHLSMDFSESSLLSSSEFFVAALQAHFPLYLSAEIAFSRYFMSNPSTKNEDSASTFDLYNDSNFSQDLYGNRSTNNRSLASNYPTGPLFSSPSVTSHIPCVATVVKEYWDRLGSPPVLLNIK